MVRITIVKGFMTPGFSKERIIEHQLEKLGFNINPNRAQIDGISFAEVASILKSVSKLGITEVIVSGFND